MEENIPQNNCMKKIKRILNTFWPIYQEKLFSGWWYRNTGMPFGHWFSAWVIGALIVKIFICLIKP